MAAAVGAQRRVMRQTGPGLSTLSDIERFLYGARADIGNAYRRFAETNDIPIPSPTPSSTQAPVLYG